MIIEDFNSCKTNERNGTYGGMAGDKEGITYQGEYWIVKYPKSTKGMRGDLISYMISPLSEFIGSHIYEILGYDVHKTVLGIRNNKLVVACKDFCETEGALREIRTIKNIYNEKLSTELDLGLSSTSSSHMVDLQELFVHLKYNPILSKMPQITERFWNCVVVDILINNNDRNNGNWGVLYEKGQYRLAPVFDNGAAFSNKYTDDKIAMLMSDEQRVMDSSLKTTTIYSKNGKFLTSQDMLSLSYPGMQKALKKNAVLINKKMPEIRGFIRNIPEKVNDIMICSNIRKEFYIKTMEVREDRMLYPALMKNRDLER